MGVPQGSVLVPLSPPMRLPNLSLRKWYYFYSIDDCLLAINQPQLFFHNLQHSQYEAGTTKCERGTQTNSECSFHLLCQTTSGKWFPSVRNLAGPIRTVYLIMGLYHDTEKSEYVCSDNKIHGFPTIQNHKCTVICIALLKLNIERIGLTTFLTLNTTSVGKK